MRKNNYFEREDTKVKKERDTRDNETMHEREMHVAWFVDDHNRQ